MEQQFYQIPNIS